MKIIEILTWIAVIAILFAVFSLMTGRGKKAKGLGKDLLGKIIDMFIFLVRVVLVDFIFGGLVFLLENIHNWHQTNVFMHPGRVYLIETAIGVFIIAILWIFIF